MKPNVLIILADQLTWRALPAYGNEYVKTPNIDRIANRATRFSQCYTPCPLCQPARGAFWTSRYPHETGNLSNGRNHHVPQLPQSIPTLGDAFSAAGYHPVHFGKRHDAGSLRGFELMPLEQIEVEAEPAWPLNVDTFQDRDTTEKVVDFLQRHTGKPYLAVADLNNPHNICGWVGENVGPHEDVPMDRELPELPPNFEDADFEQRPKAVQYICCSHRRLSQASNWNAENYQHYLAAYYHYLERLDAEVGKILDALERRPDSENTLVVFMVDHGDGMAGHRMVTKQVSMYEETMRVPFMFAGPRIVENKTQYKALTTLLDLVPTLCEYCGVAIPNGVRGVSLVPWLKGWNKKDQLPHDYVASEWHTEWAFTTSPGRMIRTARYKYVRYLENDEEEFYDLESDPWETRILVNDPASQEVLEEHRTLLRRHLDETSDLFTDLAVVVDPKWRSHAPGYLNHQGPSAPEEE